MARAAGCEGLQRSVGWTTKACPPSRSRLIPPFYAVGVVSVPMVVAVDRDYRRGAAVLDFPLGHRPDVDLHFKPRVCVVHVHVHERGFERETHCLFNPVGRADADDDHVKRDGDDGRDLTVGSNVFSGGKLSSSLSETND